MKHGYRQAKYELSLGLEPIYVRSLKPFWIGYNLAVLLQCIHKNVYKGGKYVQRLLL